MSLDPSNHMISTDVVGEETASSANGVEKTRYPQVE
jgi:hypothetical protein